MGDSSGRGVRVAEVREVIGSRGKKSIPAKVNNFIRVIEPIGWQRMINVLAIHLSLGRGLVSRLVWSK